MKKKLISLLQRKRHIVALSTILMTFIVMSCLFIDSVDITQMIDGKAVNYAKAGTTATFKMHGHIKVQGDPRNDKRLVFGFLAPKSWNLAQNARVSYTEDTFDPNIGEQNMTLIPLTEQPSNKPGLSWSAALMQESKICVSNHHSLLTVLTITSVQVQMQRNVRKPDVLR